MFRAVFLLVFFSRFFLSVATTEMPNPPSFGLGDCSDLNPSCCEHCVPFSLVPGVLRRLRPSMAPVSFLKCSLLLSLLVCGDIETNPGPASDACYICNSVVADNHHGLLCEVCSNWSHRTCVNMTVEEYFHWAAIDDGWICPTCDKEAFPFHNISHLSSLSSTSINYPPPQSSTSRSLSILSFNARSLLPKMDILRAVCSCGGYDFITVTETWLSAGVLDRELYLPGFTVIRRDRNRHGGGVAIYVSNAFSVRPLVDSGLQLELIFLECTIKSHLYTLGVFYRPPDASAGCLTSLYNYVSCLRHQNHSNMILCGDFNIDVSATPLASCTSSNLLNQLCTDFCLSQVVSKPTRVTPTSSTTIDLVLLSAPESLISSSVLSPIGTSDHNSVSVTLKLPSDHRATSRPTRSIWLYKKANISLGKQLLLNLPIAKTSDDIDVLWDRWHSHFMSVMHKCIPKRTVPVDRPTPWIDQDIQHDIRLRERLYKRFMVSKSQDWLVKYKSVRNQVVAKIRSAKQAFFQKLCSSRNSSKKFWSAIRSLKPRKTLQSIALSAGPITATSAMDKANLLNTFFASCFNPLDAGPSYDPIIVPEVLPPDLDITPDEVREHLCRINSHSALGADQISAWMLSTFAEELVPSITAMFNHSLKLGKIPHEWKRSNIVPIPKEANKSEVRFYRPISLLPIISKILERHIHSLLFNHLSSHNTLSANQFGFRPGRSTITPLLIAVHKWHLALEKRQQIGCVFFDLRKAFDSVPHQALLNRLFSLNLPLHLFCWLSNYLNSRLQRVVIGGTESSWLPVKSGVPQGSILGPLLFLVFINDLFSVPLSEGSTIMVYADDILLFKPLSSPSDLSALQLDVDHIGTWISTNYLSINEVKSKCMLISRSRSRQLNFAILLNGRALECVKHFKYLGLWISDDLSWSCHIEAVCSKARRMLGFIYRYFSPHCNASTILTLYRAHILPTLDYASIVWDPHLKKDQKLLDSVQHFALKIASRSWNSSSETLHRQFEMTPLIKRRQYFKLLVTFKFLKGFLYFPGGFFVLRLTPNLRTSHCLQLIQPFARSSSFYNSFFVQSVSLWNSLPGATVCSNSISTFKTKIRSVYL